MERRNTGKLAEDRSVSLEHSGGGADTGNVERWNVNRGFKKPRVWQDAVGLYVTACRMLGGFPFELKRVAANAIDAAHAVSRNLAEGYGRRSLAEYLYHLNVALGSGAEFHSCYVSFREAGQIAEDRYEELDALHYEVENGLLKLIESLEAKQQRGEVCHHVLAGRRGDAAPSP